MASTVTLASGRTSDFVPEVWATEALEVLRDNFVLGNTILRDSDVQGVAQYGDVIHLPYTGTFSRTAKSANTEMALTDPAGTGVTISLDKHYYTAFIVEDVYQAMNNWDVRQAYLAAAIVPLAEGIEDDLFALYSSLTYNVGSTLDVIDYADVAAATTKLTDNKAPRSDRHLVLSPLQMQNLKRDADMANYFAFANPEAIRNGAVAFIDGFNVYESQAVPIASNITYNLAYQRGAFMLAMRMLPAFGPQFGVQQSTMVDPVSGLAIRVTGGYDLRYGGLRISCDVLYGVGIVRQEKATQVRSNNSALP